VYIILNKGDAMDLDALKGKVSPERTALVVIDMQRDYCCPGGIFDRRGFDIRPALGLVDRLDRFLNVVRGLLPHIVHLKMAKVPGLPSPAAIEHNKRLGIERNYDPTFGAFYGVEPREGEMVIDKYKYSGFVSTYLDQFLRGNGISALVLTGLATNVCVESTARDGFMRDYHIVVPEDLTEGTSPDAKHWSLLNIAMFFGEVVNSESLLECWSLAGAESVASRT
jgi:ureidoacrylate peracid hydrolase